ncbi:DMT family transporter [Sporosarcina sp. CAU 1771]
MRNKKTVGGVTFGIFSGIFWAVDTVLIGVVLSMTGFLAFEEILFVAPLLSTFLHDVFSAIWMTVFLLGKGEYKTAISSLKKKPGRIIILAGTLGGPIGMTFYVLSIQSIGSSYTAVISSIYPAVGALFAYIILKDKLRLGNWFGLIMSITFIILLSYSGELVVGSNASLGLIFLIICIIGWGLECVVSAYAMKDDGIKPEHALLIRQYTSSLIFGLLIIPIFVGHSYTLQIMTSPLVLLALAGVALAGTLSYIFYYNAINIIGPIRAMAMNITYAAWAVGFSAILFGATFTWKEFIFATCIIVGSIVAVVEKGTVPLPLIGEKEFVK